MNDNQIRLARDALGLPNAAKRAFRNCGIAGPKSHADDLWRDMVKLCLAQRVDDLSKPKRHVYELTWEGAKVAIKPGEYLDLEDFTKFSR